jgi:hypothetical protein
MDVNIYGAPARSSYAPVSKGDDPVGISMPADSEGACFRRPVSASTWVVLHGNARTWVLGE